MQSLEIHVDVYAVKQELARDSSKSSLRFVRKSFPPALTVNIVGYANISTWPRTFRTISGLARSSSLRLECMARKLPKCPLTLESAGSESLQKVAASVPM
jgi:hypothetical protein